MKTSTILTLILSAVLFTNCDKRPFAHIEIHGRIVNALTNQPLQAQVQLWTGGSTPGSNGTTEFDATRTGADGSFDIKSNEGWNSEDYMILVIPDSISTHNSVSKDFHIGRNQNVNAGTIGL